MMGTDETTDNDGENGFYFELEAAAKALTLVSSQPDAAVLHRLVETAVAEGWAGGRQRDREIGASGTARRA